MAYDSARVRLAVADDLPAILSLDEQAASRERDRIEFLRHSVGRGECSVCLDGEALSGFVIIKRSYFFGRDFIELLMVAPRHRRAGVGRTLLRYAVGAAATARIFTSTNSSNQPMRSLLDSEGWSFSGELGGLDPGDPELVFYRNVPAHGQ